MKILDTLIDSLTGKDLPVKNVCCGAFWTMVTTREIWPCVDLRRAGLQGQR